MKVSGVAIRTVATVPTVQWIHPSYRDLVIEELSRDALLRVRFLETADLEGVKLAFSQVGGAKGERHLPLLRDADSWAAVQRRCLEMVDRSTPGEISAILRILRSAAVDASGDVRTHMARIIGRCCENVRLKWDREKVVLAEAHLREFFEASVLSDQLPAPPPIAPSWTRAYSELRSSITDRSQLLDSAALWEWAKLAAVLAENEPRYLRQVGFPQKYVGDVAQVLSIVTQETEYVVDTDDPEEILAEADRMVDLTTALSTLAALFPEQRQQIEAAASAASGQEDYLRQQYQEMGSDEPEPTYDASEGRSASGPSFDIQTIFSDL